MTWNCSRAIFMQQFNKLTGLRARSSAHVQYLVNTTVRDDLTKTLTLIGGIHRGKE